MVFLKKAMYRISLNKYYTKKLLYFLTDFYLMQNIFQQLTSTGGVKLGQFDLYKMKKSKKVSPLCLKN